MLTNIMVAGSQTENGIQSRTNHNSAGWIDYLLDSCSFDSLLGGCDENCSIPSREAMGHACGPTEAAPVTNDRRKPTAIDYSSQHDDFLDSLLYEQVLLRRAPDDDENNLLASDSTVGLNSSVSTCNTSASDAFSLHSSKSDASSKNGKRSIAVRLKRRSQSSPIRCTSTETNAKIQIDRARTVELDALSETEHRPSFYVHPQCCMQKDTGKGEDVGSKICARGSDQCLQKLRAKMKLLTEHAMSLPGESKKGPATMKRRNARVSTQYDNVIETRSLIELRMGFLSMTYGVLLRWDASKSRKATLVVLRKNCHDSFYPKVSKTSIVKPTVLTPHRSNVDNIKNDDSSLRKKVVDVSNLQPPYRVPRPAVMDPLGLSITILYATGLNPKSNWTVQIAHGNTVENIAMTFDSESNCLIPKASNSLKRRIPDKPTFSGFEVKLFEYRSRRKNQRRLISTMQVPSSGVEIQPTSSPKPFRLRVPCQHDPAAGIQIAITLVSDYYYWLQREVEARRIEEINGLVRRQSPNAETTTNGAAPPKLLETIQNDDESDDRWDWICCVC